MKRRIWNLMLALLALTLVLAGATAAAEDPVVIRLSGVSQYDVNDFVYMNWLEEKFNVEFECNFFTTDAWETQFTLMLADDNLPDLLLNINLPKADADKYGADGYLLDLTTCLDKMPNYAALLEKDQALAAFSRINSEKMFATSLDDARELVRIAHERGLQLTAAPDTFLGARIQTAIQLIDSGLIGEPIAAEIALQRCYRHSDFKKEAEKRFAFCPGGGYINDMGGYYLTALVAALGSIERVSGFYRTYRPERTFRHPLNPAYGTPMTVDEAPNCYAAALSFACGAMASLSMTSEVRGGGSHLDIHGTEGTLHLEDPNEFGGTLTVRLQSGQETAFPLTHAYTENSRGLGAADAAYALRLGRKPRCAQDLIFHVFEAAKGIEQSCDTGSIYRMTSTCERPAPLRPGCMEYPEMALDE